VGDASEESVKSEMKWGKVVTGLLKAEWKESRWT